MEEEEVVFEQTVVEPEEVELGLDLGESFDFGQSQSLNDFYDIDSMPLFTDNFEEPEEMADATEVEEIAESIETEEAIEVEEAVMEAEEFVEEAPVVEDVAEEIAESVEMVPEVVEEVAMIEEVPDEVELLVDEAPVIEEAEIVDEVEIVEEAVVEEPVIEEPAVAEPVIVNPFAKENDFFDWSSVDEEAYMEEEVSDEQEDAPVVKKSNDEYAEFVWTDDMIKALDNEDKSDEEIVETSDIASAEEYIPEYVGEYEVEAVEETVAEVVEEFVPEEVFTDVQEEIAATAVTEPEIPVVVEQTYEMPEDTSEFSVYQATGNVTIEETVEPEPQYSVFQSSGNFKVEEPEEVVVEEPQFTVFQSSGIVQEETIEEVVPTYKTYGDPEPEPVKAEPEKTSSMGNKFGDFEFDLDLPDFEPFDKSR